MSARSIIVVFLALGSGVSAAVLVRQFRAPVVPPEVEVVVPPEVEVVQVLVAATHISPRTQISEALMQQVSDYCGQVPQPDDITLLILSRITPTA